MTGQEKDDLLIQVTSWTGLPVYRNEGKDGSTRSRTFDCY